MGLVGDRGPAASPRPCPSPRRDRDGRRGLASDPASGPSAPFGASGPRGPWPRGRPRPCAPLQGVPPLRSRASWPPPPRASPRRRRQCPGAVDRRSALGGRLVPGAADRRAGSGEPSPPSSCPRESTAGAHSNARTAMTATAPPIMAPRPKRWAGRGFRGDGGLRGRGIDRRRPCGCSDRRRRRGGLRALDPRLRQEDLDLFGERLQMGLERGGDRVQPVHRADVVLERARRRDVLDADRDDGEALRDRAVDFPLDVGRRVRMRREDEHHHPAPVDPVDDRLAVVGPVGDVPRGDPAGDPVSLERGAQRIRRGLVLARVLVKTSWAMARSSRWARGPQGRDLRRRPGSWIRTHGRRCDPRLAS